MQKVLYIVYDAYFFVLCYIYTGADWPIRNLPGKLRRGRRLLGALQLKI